MSVSCLWTRLGPIKVVMLTTLVQKIVMLITVLRTNRLFNDLLMNIYEFNAPCYPVMRKKNIKI